MFAQSKFLMAACFFSVVQNALSMIQQRTEVVIVQAGDPPSLSDVKDQLGAVNDTLDKVSETLETINSTAYDVMDQFLNATTALVKILPLFQKAADAASKLPGGENITERTTKYIDLINATLDDAQDVFPHILTEILSQFDPILPAVQEIADEIISEYMDAAQSVLDLSNLTDQNSKKHVANSAKKHKAHKAHKRKHPQNGLALLHERALRSEHMASLSVSVDKSVSQKGNSNPCSKSLARINKANTTIGRMAEKIEVVNVTGLALLRQLVEIATSSFQVLNSTVAPALEGLHTIPRRVLSPITTGLDEILSVADTLNLTMGDQLSTVEGMVGDAQSTLYTVYALSDALVESVTEAECDGACGKKMETACET